jgi:hypothetical protein|tara:strand:+ start:501 stop:1031 length:531 start_codon:yes stop_codon:yes gene_type:complete
MASGKTYIADALHEKLGYTKFSLATGVKDLGRDVFLMEGKDRKLLQQIGMKMREIDTDVWINLLMRKVVMAQINQTIVFGAKGYESQVVVDDCRFMNEVRAFKAAGYKLIRIHIEDDLQIKRLKQTYGKKADQHISNRKDDSESEMGDMNDKMFDLVVNAVDDDSVVEQVLAWVMD